MPAAAKNQPPDAGVALPFVAAGDGIAPFEAVECFNPNALVHSSPQDDDLGPQIRP